MISFRVPFWRNCQNNYGVTPLILCVIVDSRKRVDGSCFMVAAYLFICVINLASVLTSLLQFLSSVDANMIKGCVSFVARNVKGTIEAALRRLIALIVEIVSVNYSNTLARN